MKILPELIRSVAAILFSAVTFASYQASACAQTASPFPLYPQSFQLRFKPNDLAKLLQATKDIESSPNVKLLVIRKAPADMPIYDPLFHYAGIDPTTHNPLIWMSSTVGKHQADSEAKLAALDLACMDSGLAGPWWKGVYDLAASYDAHLPATEANRYLMRLRITALVQEWIYKNEFGY